MRMFLPANISRALKRIPRLRRERRKGPRREIPAGRQLGAGTAGLKSASLRDKHRPTLPSPWLFAPDLVQEGTVGLLEAVRRFNPDHRNPFVDIRHMSGIRAAMQDYVLRSGSVVRTVTTPKSGAMFFSPRLRGLDPENDMAVNAVAEDSEPRRKKCGHLPI